jgi:hypothetical protein
MPLDMALLPSIAKFLDAFVSINPTALIVDPDDLPLTTRVRSSGRLIF